MRFVPVKDVDQQSVLMMHRARNLLVRQRTMLVNALRAHLAEFGIIAPQGLRHVERLAGAIEEDSPALPELARSILRLVVAQLNDTQAKVRQIEATDQMASELTPADLLDIVVVNGLHFNGATQQGVVFHLIGALSEFGKLGIVCVAPSFDEADRLYLETVAVLDREQEAK